MYSTKELCALLGVERSWVSKYLRHLGRTAAELGKAALVEELRTLYYDESEVLAYLNEHAVFLRQTEFVNLGKYLTPDEIKGLWEFLWEMEDEEEEKKKAQVELGRDYDRQVLIVEYLKGIGKEIAGVVLIKHIKGAARRRGKYEWRKVRNVSIESLCDLTTMRRDKTSELVYRDNFMHGRIRVCVHGHTWYMDGRREEADMHFWVLCMARGD